MDFKTFFYALILLWSCTSCLEQPQEAVEPAKKDEINNKGNYLINRSGDTIPTGVAVPSEGKWVRPDSTDRPVIISLEGQPKVVSAHANVFPAGQPQVIAFLEEMEEVKFGENGAPAPTKTRMEEHLAPGQMATVKQPKPVPAGAPGIKDRARYDIQFLSTEHGLRSMYVGSILQGHDGAIWIAYRSGGFGRYDGRTFTHFSGEEGLLDYNSMLPDRQGNIWFAGNNEGLGKYDGSTFSYYSFKEDRSLDQVRGLFEDSRGNIWFIANGALKCFDGKYLTHFPIEIEVVGEVFEDSQGYIWTWSRDDKFIRFKPLGEGSVYLVDKQIHGLDLINAIAEDSQGRIWIGGSKLTQSGPFGEIILFVPPALSAVTDSTETGKSGVFLRPFALEELRGNQVADLMADDQGNMWIATGKQGVLRYGPVDLDPEITQFTTKEGLTNDEVTAILEDDDGNLWFGTAGGGLCRYDPSSFSYFSTNEGLSNNQVYRIQEDSRGHIWLGTGIYGGWGNGVMLYDERNFTHFTGAQGFPLGTVFAILEDSRGNLWFGGAGGTARFSPSVNGGGIAGNYAFYPSAQGPLPVFGPRNGWVWSMMEDSKGNIWSGHGGAGFRYYSDEEYRGQENFQYHTPDEGFLNPFVFDIEEDQQGRLWLATGDGVSVYEPADLDKPDIFSGDRTGGMFLHLTTDEGLSDNFVNSILASSLGNYWIGTRAGGLNIYHPASDGGLGTFSHFKKEDGLGDGSVNSILEDQNGNIWINTEKHIQVFVPKPETRTIHDPDFNDYRLLSFGTQDGLKPISFSNTLGPLLDSKNRIWWGSTSGVCVLDLNKFEWPDKAPRSVFLTHLEVNQQFVDFRRLQRDTSYLRSFDFGTTLQQSFDSVAAYRNYPVDLKLPYDMDHLTFHFSAIDWDAPHKIQYSYRIEGLDRSWSIPSEENKAEYRNLPHGRHKLQVRAIGEAQIWSEPVEYAFTILPPWWLTWWAKILYALAGLGGVRGIVQWRTATLRKRQKVLEQTVTERTAEVVAQKEELAIKNEVITKEKERSEELLLNILPAEIAEELKINGTSPARDFEQVTVLFTDFKQFTTISEQLTAQELVSEINTCFKAFDEIITRYGIEKIKTIGDAYMAAGGLHLPRKTKPRDVILAALEMQQFMRQRQRDRQAQDRPFFEMRCGIHTGPVVAGIVGVKKFQYDIWGDTVNTASRMESSSEEGKVNISHFTYELVKADPLFRFVYRGKIRAKNKGQIDMYFVEVGR